MTDYDPDFDNHWFERNEERWAHKDWLAQFDNQYAEEDYTA